MSGEKCCESVENDNLDARDESLEDIMTSGFPEGLQDDEPVVQLRAAYCCQK